MQSTESRTDWLPLDGNWKFDGDNATFEHDPAESTQSRHPLGVALSALRAPRGGCLSADVKLPDNLEGDPAARLLVGFEAASKDYFTVGLGGYGAAYVLHECRGDVHRQLHGLGRRSHLRPGGKYHVAAAVHSHRVTLAIDGISVFTQDLSRPLTAQAGVFAHAHGTVRFEAFDAADLRRHLAHIR